jgi:hypothetical protein
MELSAARPRARTRVKRSSPRAARRPTISRALVSARRGVATSFRARLAPRRRGGRRPPRRTLAGRETRSIARWCSPASRRSTRRSRSAGGRWSLADHPAVTDAERALWDAAARHQPEWSRGDERHGRSRRRAADAAAVQGETRIADR